MRKSAIHVSFPGDGVPRRRRAVGATVEAPHLDARPNLRCRHISSRAFPRARHGTPRAGEATPARTRIVSCRRFREARRLRWCAKTFLTTRRTRPHPLPSARRLRACFALSSPLDGGRSIHDDVLGTYQFPTLLEPCTRDVAADLGAALDWAHRSRYDIEARLAATGALLFRGFPIDSAEHFAKFVEALGYPNFAYQGAGGNAVRENVVGDRVFTANESPPDRVIPFHHELAQTPVFPHRVLFFWNIPAATGGATPLLDSHRVYTRIRDQLPEFMEELETKGVRYTRVMTRDDRPDSAVGRGWAGTFGVETLDQLRAALDGTGQSFEILQDVPGVDPTRCPIRHYTSTLAAIRVDDADPRRRARFFNQLLAAHDGWRDELNPPGMSVVFGDGSPIPADAMEVVARAHEEEAVAVPWEDTETSCCSIIFR